MKKMKKKKESFAKDLDALKALIEKLDQKEQYAKRLNRIYGGDYNLNRIQKLEHELDEIIATHDIATNTYKLYSKKVDDNILKVTTDIKTQFKRLFNIAIIILVILLLSFLFKYLAKKTISDNERYYMANKAINFTNFILIVLVLLFSFLENVSYMVTVLGFASAGLAFAMKDLFMSVLGWIVIVFGGSFHVGDRIKVVKNGVQYVGDIVDISLLRMTLLEDVTLTTYEVNRRSGRIIFVPNNYIFTELLANYTHGKIKTVWDGVDFTITYDSNYKKASYLAKEIVKKYSKGYTDISRKQLNMLRSQYSLKNINVEPRTYTFMEQNGIKISCWYMTNSYAALTLRSNIFANIIDAINEEDDIKIAYPTQIVNIKRDKNIPPKEDGEESIV
jgi:small-conductance mechanosensitive channel